MMQGLKALFYFIKSMSNQYLQQSTNNKPEILEKELSYKIYGIFLKISRDYGFFGKEELYQNACKEELKLNKLSYRSKPTILVISKTTNKKIGIFIPDFIIEEKIIVEIKAQKQILSESIHQLLKYLEFSKYEIGYLVNFGTPHIQIIRKVYSNERKNFFIDKRKPR